MFAIMSTLHLKDNGDLHVLELASIPNKCMQCCLFLKKPSFEMCLLRGVPQCFESCSENYIRSLCNVFPPLLAVNENHAE